MPPGPVIPLGGQISGALLFLKTQDSTHNSPSTYTSVRMPMFFEPPRTMELGNILNTKLTAKAAIGHPMQYAMQHSMPHELQHPQPQHHPQYAQPAYLNGRIKSENGSERGISPHPSDPSSRYSSTPAQSIAGYPTMQNSYMDRYPSPAGMNVGAPMMNNYNSTSQAPDHPYPGPPAPALERRPTSETPQSTGPPKAFACSTCGKGFARRSDLARHGMCNYQLTAYAFN